MKILSENKFRDFDGFEYMGDKETYILETNKTTLRCTNDHEFLTDNRGWVEAQNLVTGDILSGNDFISFKKTNVIEDVYDAINVDETSSFYAEGLTAHNCFLLYIDEHAFVENWDEFSASVLPTLSSGETTKMIFTSTPHGLNHFYYYVEGARQKKNGFALIEVDWREVPGRDEAWRLRALSELNNNQLKFDQEYDLEFIGSSGTLISGAALKLLNPMKELYVDEHLFKYKERVQGDIYVMVVDTSRGKALDYSAFSVINVTKTPYEQVCTYRNNTVTPSDYAVTCSTIAEYYNDAQILVELNDLGSQVADLLFDVERQLISTANNGRNGKQVSYSTKSEKGLTISAGTKASGCAMLKLLIEGNKLIINDRFTIAELNKFSQKGNTYQAEVGAHDDLVMGLVHFGWLSSVGFIDQLNDLDIMAALREKTEEDHMNDLLPFGIISNGLEDFDEVIELHEDEWLHAF